MEGRPFSLAEIVTDVRPFELNAAQKGLAFIKDIPSDIWGGTLAGDRFRLRQVLANFLSNAIKFTATGSVTLRLRSSAGNNPQELIVTFAVQDTGIGIKPELISALFTPFQ